MMLKTSYYIELYCTALGCFQLYYTLLSRLLIWYTRTLVKTDHPLFNTKIRNKQSIEIIIANVQ